MTFERADIFGNDDFKKEAATNAQEVFSSFEGSAALPLTKTTTTVYVDSNGNESTTTVTETWTR